MSSVLVSPEAAADLLEIWRQLAFEHSPEFADQQLQAIDAVCRGLADWSVSGRRREDLQPEVCSANASPHVVFYREAGGDIAVIRVLSAARDATGFGGDA